MTVAGRNARFLARTELNVLRERGLSFFVQWNAMLANAWARERLSRSAYRSIDEREAVASRKSDTVFVFGSGASLNSITAAEWQAFRAHDVFGFNAFYHQRWIPVDFHLLRVGIYGELKWHPFAQEVAGILADNPLYHSTTFVMQQEFLAQFCNQMLGYGLLPRKAKVLRFHTRRGDGPPSRRLADGVRHITGTLSDVVNVCYALGWKHIVLVGIDLYDSRYFYLPQDKTPGLDPQSGLLKPSEFNTYRGIRFDQTHSTARHGVVQLMQDWRAIFNRDGVQLSVYNPQSLLTEVLPVYPQLARPQEAHG
jgi:hypothetical protein